jgi:predicted DNA-binding ribbon-helix-helix protein
MKLKENMPPYREQVGESYDRSTLVSRNVTILGRRTSVRLEPDMWQALAEIAKRERCTVHDICTLIYARKKANTSLTAAIRVFLMLYFKSSSTEEGHLRAGHGDFNAMRRRARFSIEDEKRLSGKILPLSKVGI